MSDYFSLTMVPLIWPALAMLFAVLFAGSWLLANRLRGNRRVPGSAPGGLEAAAIILLLIGGFFFLVGWVAGAVLLWISPRWRVADKLLGTLVWPGGLAVVLVAASFATFSETCSGGTGIPTSCVYSGPPPWAGGLALVLIVLGQLATATWLWRRARKAPTIALTGQA